nr:hypothetical protein [Cupriavidus sp. amp6]
MSDDELHAFPFPIEFHTVELWGCGIARQGLSCLQQSQVGFIAGRNQLGQADAARRGT